METVTVKMERRQLQLLKDIARTRGCSKAAVIRDLVERHLTGKKRPSLHEQAKDLCGSISGPRDLSTRKLTGYGRD
jgi:predicted DNA-binding ribbon-helix-helix protein